MSEQAFRNQIVRLRRQFQHGSTELLRTGKRIAQVWPRWLHSACYMLHLNAFYTLKKYASIFSNENKKVKKSNRNHVKTSKGFTFFVLALRVLRVVFDSLRAWEGGTVKPSLLLYSPLSWQ